eukprot:5799302-Pyramimonas_sp.AAC.1
MTIRKLDGYAGECDRGYANGGNARSPNEAVGLTYGTLPDFERSMSDGGSPTLATQLPTWPLSGATD